MTDHEELAGRPDFDEMAKRFTESVKHVAGWRQNYFGAAYASRIKAAIAHLRQIIAEAEQHPEIGPSAYKAQVEAQGAEIERLREALKEAVDVFEGMNDDEINEDLLPRLRAALDSSGKLLPVEPREGWVLVPREPTDAMLSAADIASEEEPPADMWTDIFEPYRSIYRAMLSVASASPAVEERTEAERLYEFVRAKGFHGPDAKPWAERSEEHKQLWRDAVLAAQPSPAPTAPGEPLGYITTVAATMLADEATCGAAIYNLRHGDYTVALYAHPSPTVVKEMAEALKAGWNACRKSIYSVCEDVDQEAEETYLKASSRGSATSTEGHLTEFQSGHVSGYRSGMVHAAKSIARGFNAMEAEDDDNVRAALAAHAAEGRS